MIQPSDQTPATMLVRPTFRKAPIAKLRRFAITHRALPTRTGDQSSSSSKMQDNADF
jgi:hypothetical protein